MDIKAAKLDLIQKLMSVEKVSLLNKLRELIDKEMVVGYTVEGEPLTQDAYNKRLQAAEDQIAYGAYTSQEDIEDEAEKW